MLDGLFAQLEREPGQDSIRDAWVGAPASIATVVTLPDSVVRMPANTRVTVSNTAQYADAEECRVLGIPDLRVYNKAVSARTRRLHGAKH
jgi:hypothetical protein